MIIPNLYCQNIINGLSQNTNFHIYNDSFHQLWISSTEGVNLYDGRKVLLLKGDKYGFLGNNIQSSFFADLNHNIWFTTNQALHVYYRALDSIQYFQLTDNFQKPIFKNYSITALDYPFLTIKAGNKVITFNVNKKMQHSCRNIDLSSFSNDNTSSKEVNNDFIVIGRNGSNLEIRNYNSQDSLTSKFIIPANTFYRKIKFKNRHEVIYSVDNTIYIYNTISKQSNLLYYCSKPIKAFQIFDENSLLLLTESKIKLLNLFSFLASDIYEMNHQGNVINIFTKDLNTIFYSVDKEGVYYFNLDKIKFDHHKLIANKKISNSRSIIQNNLGNYYHCSRDNGIVKYDSDFKIINHIKPKTEFPFILNISEISSNEIIANGGYSIYSLIQNSNVLNKLKIISQEKDCFFTELHITNRGKIWLLNGEENGMFELTKTRNNNFQLDSIFSRNTHNEFTTVEQFKNGDLVIGISGNSLNYYTFKNKFNFVKNINISSDLKSIWELPNSKEVYLSSSSGLFHFPNGLEGDFTKLRDKKGLLDQTIYYILGHKEFLYLSSNQGLLRYNTIDSTVHQFTLADGIQGLEYNTTAGLKDKDGNFLFGGTNGLTVFHPDSIKFLDYNTPIHLSNILVNDEEYDWEYNISLQDTIKFDYENNTLTFQFHGIDYSDPKAVELKCIMENYDKEWIHIEKNDGSVRYPNLPPGHYTFKMRATNSDKIWSNIIREIDVTITPPFWQTWWFRILSLLAISSITWLLIKSYYKRQLVKKDLELREQRLQFEKQEALQYERNRIAAEMHDDLGGGLTSIKYLAHRALKRKDNKNPNEIIEKIIGHSADLINNMSEIIWAMNSGYDTLPNLIAYIRNYLKKQCNEFELDLELIIQSEIKDVEFSGQKRRNIFLVIKEAFHNTLKYAEADQIKFEVKVENNNLTIKYKDNGIGFSKKEIVPGNGLKNIKRRVEEINGKLTFNSDNGVELIMVFPV